VSHLRPDERVQRHRKSDCKRGRHEYGEPQNIGAGISRRVCEVCGWVAIDLTGAHELTSPVISEKENLIGKVSRESEET
jgi:hypothetical protein